MKHVNSMALIIENCSTFIGTIVHWYQYTKTCTVWNSITPVFDCTENNKQLASLMSAQRVTQLSKTLLTILINYKNHSIMYIICHRLAHASYFNDMYLYVCDFQNSTDKISTNILIASTCLCKYLTTDIHMQLCINSTQTSSKISVY